MPAPGELSLQKLLSTISPSLDPHEYTYCRLATTTPPHPLPSSLRMLFREDDAWTLVLRQDEALRWEQQQKMETAFPCRMITLNVHSSLDAVGFLAVITTKLAACGLGVNPVSAFAHDHLFVPAGREGEVLSALEELVRDSAAATAAANGHAR